MLPPSPDTFKTVTGSAATPFTFVLCPLPFALCPSTCALLPCARRRPFDLVHVDRIEERHHLPELLADLLDHLISFASPRLVELRPSGGVFGHPLPRVFAALDACQHLLHVLPRFLGDDLRPAGVVAVLGCVADRVAHV